MSEWNFKNLLFETSFSMAKDLYFTFLTGSGYSRSSSPQTIDLFNWRCHCWIQEFCVMQKFSICGPHQSPPLHFLVYLEGLRRSRTFSLNYVVYIEDKRAAATTVVACPIWKGLKLFCTCSKTAVEMRSLG